MVAAVLGLVGFLISLYLWLWKVGLLGALVCGDGGCEVVQLSEYAELLGIPVAFFGMLAYLVLLALSLLACNLAGRSDVSPPWVSCSSPPSAWSTAPISPIWRRR